MATPDGKKAGGKETDLSRLQQDTALERAGSGSGATTFWQRLRFAFSGADPNEWFGPGKAMDPVAPPEQKGRAFDYQYAANVQYQPRKEAGESAIDFMVLRRMADPALGGLDLLRLAIETRKDQMAGQHWSIKHRDGKFDGGDRARVIESALRRPDGVNTYRNWQRMLLEDMLVLDAPVIYVRKTKGKVKLPVTPAAKPKLLQGEVPPPGQKALPPKPGADDPEGDGSGGRDGWLQDGKKNGEAGADGKQSAGEKDGTPQEGRDARDGDGGDRVPGNRDAGTGEQDQQARGGEGDHQGEGGDDGKQRPGDGDGQQSDRHGAPRRDESGHEQQADGEQAGGERRGFGDQQRREPGESQGEGAPDGGAQRRDARAGSGDGDQGSQDGRPGQRDQRDQQDGAKGQQDGAQAQGAEDGKPGFPGKAGPPGAPGAKPLDPNKDADGNPTAPEKIAVESADDVGVFLEAIDGASIKRLIRDDGRVPLPPDPAYLQVLKGMPAFDYTADEMIYPLRNPRTNRIYGYSPVEQVLTTVNIALRRQLSQLQYYTEGSVPDMIFGVPETWTPDQLEQFQIWWDTMLVGDTAARRKVRFVPGGTNAIPTKEPVVKDTWDEWLARIICYAFSLSPQALVMQMNRATAQTAHDTAQMEGLEPIKLWWKDLMDLLLDVAFDSPELEFVFEDEEINDPKVKAEVFQIAVGKPWMKASEAREAYGLPEDATLDETAPPGPPGGMPPGMPGGPGGELGPHQPPGSHFPPGGPPHPGGGAPPFGGKPNGAGGAQRFGQPPNGKPNGAAQHFGGPPAQHQFQPKKMEAAEIMEAIAGLLKGDAPGHSPGAAAQGKGVRVAESSGLKRPPDANEKRIAVAAARYLAAARAGVLARLRAKAEKVAKDARDPTQEDIEEILSGMNPEEAAVFSRIVEDTLGDIAKLATRAGMDDIEAQTGDFYGDALEQADAEAADWAASRAAELVTGIDQTTQDELRDMISESLDATSTSWKDLADEIEGEFLFSAERAEVIARTERAYAETAGNLIGWKATGEVDQKEWKVAQDEYCAFCEDLDGEVIDIDDQFEVEVGKKSVAVDGPPLHPNACFGGTTYAPYGHTEQMVRALYRGPAVRVTAEQKDAPLRDAGALGDGPRADSSSQQPAPLSNGGGWDGPGAAGPVGAIHKVTTIGVHHPMLTRRGWVPAGELKEGDELLHDRLADPDPLARDAAEPDLEQVSVFEDAFSALAARFGHAPVAAARSYFHGDEVAVYGEVEVVRAEGSLLDVLDPCGIEQLCECRLTGTYPDAQHVAGCGACLALLERLFSSATGGVSGLDLSRALLGGPAGPDAPVGGPHGGAHGGAPLGAHVGPPRFHALRVSACHRVSFEGLAFDASTSSAAYANGGLVVKNCRCVLLPVLSQTSLGAEAEASDAEQYEMPEDTVEQMAKYDPDQPRGDDGRWASGRFGSGPAPSTAPEPGVRVFHGTLREYLDSILKTGLTITGARQHRQYKISDYYEGSRGESIYVGKSEKEAQFWAGGATNESPAAVVEISLPKSEANKLVDDELVGGGAKRYPGNIKPEWIVGAQAWERGGWQKVPLHKSEGEEYVTLWLGIVLGGEPAQKRLPSLKAIGFLDAFAKDDEPGGRYDPDQPRDYHGRWSSSGGGSGEEQETRQDPAGNMAMGHWEARVREAVAADSLKGVRESWSRMGVRDRDQIADPTASIPAAISGLLGDRERPATDDAKADVRSRVDQYGDQITQQARDLIAGTTQPLHDDLKAMGVKDELAAKICMDATDAMIAQDLEAQSRTLGDHGAYHLEGDARMAMAILKAMPGEQDTPENRIVCRLAAAYHDIGYLTPPSHVFLDTDHPRWSAMYVSEAVLPSVKEAMGTSTAIQVLNTVTGHDWASIDWAREPTLSAFAVADNLALFQHEKMPAMVREMPENMSALVALGRKQIDRDEAVSRIRENIGKRDDLSQEKRDRFMHATSEMTSYLPRAMLGMVGAKIDSFDWSKEENHLNVHVTRYRANEDLCKVLDLGQEQFKKMVTTYKVDPKELDKPGGAKFKRGDDTVMVMQIHRAGHRYGKVVLVGPVHGHGGSHPAHDPHPLEEESPHSLGLWGRHQPERSAYSATVQPRDERGRWVARAGAAEGASTIEEHQQAATFHASQLREQGEVGMSHFEAMRAHEDAARHASPENSLRARTASAHANRTNADRWARGGKVEAFPDGPDGIEKGIPDQPRDDHGRWTSGGDSARNSTADWGDFRGEPGRDLLLELKRKQAEYEDKGGQRGVRYSTDVSGKPMPAAKAEELARGWAVGLPSSVSAFVMDEGGEHPNPDKPPEIRLGVPKECFANAATLVIGDPNKYDYAEGMVITGKVPFAMHHAFAIDKATGTVVDPTLGWDPAARYYGVRMTADQLRVQILKTKYYGVLLDGRTERPTGIVTEKRGYLPRKKG